LFVFDCQPGRIFKPAVFIHIPAAADTGGSPWFRAAWGSHGGGLWVALGSHVGGFRVALRRL
jgi:hypothetical protein